MAFDSKLVQRMRHASKGTPIAVRTPLSALAEHLPYLYGPLKNRGTVETLLQDAEGSPMVSFIASNVALDSLVEALKALLLVKTNDGNRWPLRYADTRILPELLALSSEGAFPLSSAIASWWWPDRMGDLKVFVADHCNQEDVAPADHLFFNDAQFGRMLTAAQPDAIIDQLYQACPDILDRWLPHQNFAKVRSALKELPAACRGSAELEIRWCSLALTFNEPLSNIDWFSNALQVSNSIGELLARLDEIPDDVWEGAANGVV
ncbi:DUF4123 domain-containing protein [Dechloromonas sp. XY25]|uniref:DUF4123 domain-containing protein n=2 Tax=Dechloromonas hankyongensis TaxID=2908002 RepID=A0ABS9K1I2_9RHOO|nr:DUF4123 domain-containing protein [Dechloromonas hankyongensis]